MGRYSSAGPLLTQVVIVDLIEIVKYMCMYQARMQSKPLYSLPRTKDYKFLRLKSGRVEMSSPAAAAAAKAPFFSPW